MWARESGTVLTMDYQPVVPVSYRLHSSAEVKVLSALQCDARSLVHTQGMAFYICEQSGAITILRTSKSKFQVNKMKRDTLSDS